MPTFLYARTSTDEQSNGLEAQCEALLAKTEHEGWEARLVTEHASGKTLARRPELKAAMEALDSGDCERLVVTNLSRLTRSVADFASILDRAQANGWALVVLDMGGSELDTSSATGRLAARMLMEVMQWEREVIAERTRAGLAAAKRAGKQLGKPSTTPREVVGRILQMREEGLGYLTIANRLNERGVPGPAGATSKWTGTKVRRVVMRERGPSGGRT